MLYGKPYDSGPPSHDHEWELEPNVVWDEDVFVTWNCMFVEITGSVTDHSRDEVYYEEGAKCAATKTAVYDLYIADDADERVEYSESEGAQRMYEYLWDRHEDRIEEEAEMLDPFDPMEGFSIDGGDVGLGEEYTVVYELDKTYVDEDWK